MTFKMFKLTMLGMALMCYTSCFEDEKNSVSTPDAISSSSAKKDSMSSSFSFSSSTLLSSSSQNNVQAYSVIKSSKPALQRVVGYFPYQYRSISTLVANPAFSTLTHLNLAFINPDDSTLSFSSIRNNSALQSTLNELRPAQKQGLKINMSIGGGGAPAWIKGLITPENKMAYIDSLMKLVNDLNLDGVDVDFEGSLLNQKDNYNQFVQTLAAQLKSKGKGITIAIAGWQKTLVTQLTYETIDYANIMAYDYTGPWTPTKVSPHSSYKMAIADLNSFTALAGMSASKAVLGVPFYAHCFSKDESGVPQGNSLSFEDVTSTYPNAVDADSVGVRNTPEGICYYNGRNTIRDKSLYARDFGGIMIWELGQDAQGDLSLLKVISDHARP